MSTKEDISAIESDHQWEALLFMTNEHGSKKTLHTGQFFKTSTDALWAAHSQMLSAIDAGTNCDLSFGAQNRS